MKCNKILSHLQVIAGYALSETDRRFKMPEDSGPGVNAHSVAPDQAVGFLADLGFDPESFSEEALRLAAQFIEVGYCLGDEGARADDGYPEDEDEDLAILVAEAAGWRGKYADKQAELVRSVRRVGLLEREVTSLNSLITQRDEAIRGLQAETDRMRQKLLRIENILG